MAAVKCSGMISPDDLAKIREIRSKTDLTIKPSPFLKSHFSDGCGGWVPVNLRQYQKIGVMNLLMSPRMILGDDTGLGKCQPIDSLVLTLSGWVMIGDLKVGDEVVGADGKPTRVLGVFPRGQRQVYRVVMSDGSSTECCDEHLWTVRTGNSRRFGDGWHVRDLRQIVEKGLKRQRNSNGLRWEIPVVAPIDFPHANLDVDPYLLGVLLGDGSMVNTSITNGDPELFRLAEKRFPIDCKYGSVRDGGITRNVVGSVPGYNSLKSALRRLDLFKCNWYTKSIPEKYLFASIQQRTDLLRGLMDTDGYISKDGKVTQFYSSNGVLVRDFVRLVQSLGGVAKVHSKVPVLRKKSKAKRGKPAFTVTVSLPNSIIPFSLSRKVRRWTARTKYFPSRRIAEVVPSRVVECVCIRVAAHNNLYVTDEFIVTHNTLEVLSAIGYVWLKEPEYVPIVITKKSSLYQWEAETQKFLQNMDTVTIDGDPYERSLAYEEFFLRHDPNRKRVLILTYDALLKDEQPCVIRKSDHKATAAEKKRLAVAKKTLKSAQAAAKAKQTEFEAWFSLRPYDVWDHAKTSSAIGAGDRKALPPGWNEDDEKHLQDLIDLQTAETAWKEEAEKADLVVHPTIISPGIAGYVSELQKKHPSAKLMLIMDEVHTVKNHKGKVHAAAANLSNRCTRVFGLTATPVKNRLMEFFSLFRIIVPGLFPKITHFQNDFCIVKMQRISGNRQVPVVVGYKNLDEFVRVIEPFYLSRRKYDVAAELPSLVTRELQCELTDLQEELYDMAESGLVEKDADPDSSSAAVLGAMTFIQEAVNSPTLLNDDDGNPWQGNSPKIDTIVDLLEDELDGIKTIIFSRFERMVTATQEALQKNGVKCVRITGKESKASDREKAKTLFQDLKSGVNVILITEAGAESINLQVAEHFIFIDSPWSWGTYVQLIGRMIRIGSEHRMVVATHLVGVRKDGRKTIDQYVIKKLKSKKALADKVAGEGLKGGLEFEAADDIMELVDMIKSGKKPPEKALAEKKPPKSPAAPAKPSKGPSRGKESQSEEVATSIAFEIDI